MCFHRLFLYAHFKILFTFRTADGVPTLSIGQTQGGLTMRASTVTVGLAVGKFLLLQGDPCARLGDQPKILLVFRLTLIDIAGENAEKHPDQQGKCRKIKGLEKDSGNGAGKIRPKQRLIQLIHAVAPCHGTH